MNNREPAYLAERAPIFWEKVDKRGPRQPHMGSRCWMWLGATGGGDGGSYGKFRYDGESIGAHRFAWLVTFGDPGDKHVLHHCDYGLCVRPMHLFLGTNVDNIRDMDAKRRRKRGSQLAHAKLNEGAVLEIKQAWERYVEKHGWQKHQGRHKVGEKRRHGRMCFYERMAERFQVAPPTVAKVIDGQLWKHVAGEADLEIKVALAKLTERERVLLGL